MTNQEAVKKATEFGRKFAKAFFYAGNQIKEDTVIDLGSRYNNPTK